jgi:hypothetical protein
MLPDELRPDVELVSISSVVGALVRRLGVRLGRPGRARTMTEDVTAISPVDQPGRRTPVVVCADVLLTANTAETALRELHRWDATLLAVVAPVDAREGNEPLEILGHRVPVVSLARVRFGRPDVPADEIIDVDPVLRRPVRRRLPVPTRYLWDTADFLDTCGRIPGAIVLGHIERPANRHFAVYFDAAKLIDGPDDVHKMLTDRLLDEIGGWKPGTGPLVVCRPGTTDTYSARLAELVHRLLPSRITGIAPPEFRSVPRDVFGSRHAFPDAIDRLPDGASVVVLDWGSLDTSTTWQLIRLVAEAGARRILCLTLLSQLHAHDERALTMVRTVSDGTDEGEVPVSVRFITTLAITPSLAHDCSLCRFAAELREDVGNRSLPPPIAEYAKGLADQLRPTNREDALKQAAAQATDAFGEPVDPADGLAYLRLRGPLMAALRDTTAVERARDLIARIAGGAGNTTDRDAVVRLLVAERQFLKQRPVRLNETRAAVATIASSIALDSERGVRLRSQALVVLVAVAPAGWVEELPRLWRSAQDRAELRHHLIYQIYRLIHRPGDQLVNLEQMRVKVTECLAATSDTVVWDPANDANWLMSRVLVAVELVGRRRSVGTVEEACRSLRQHYTSLMRIHFEAARAVVMIKALLGSGPAGDASLDDDEWGVVTRGWRTIELFLSERVLPFLPAFKPLLRAGAVGDQFALEQRLLLDRLTERYAAGYLDQTGAQLYGLRRYQRTGDEIMAERTRRDIVRRLDNLEKTVLASGANDSRPASLAEYIDACVVWLDKQLNTCVRALAEDKHIGVRIAPHDDVEVFCHADVLGAVVTQLLDNADKHRPAGSPGVDIVVEIAVEVRDRDVVVRFRNAGTDPQARGVHGSGLKTSADMLRGFGASLRVVDSPPAGSTFEVELGLCRWNT